MDMAIIFMVVASIAPFLTIHIRKFWLAGIQVLLLIGMWTYFIQSFNSPSGWGGFSVLWLSFYASLVVSEIAYVMFAVYLAKKIQAELKSRQSEDGDDPVTEL